MCRCDDQQEMIESYARRAKLARTSPQARALWADTYRRAADVARAQQRPVAAALLRSMARSLGR